MEEMKGKKAKLLEIIVAACGGWGVESYKIYYVMDFS